MFTRSHDAVIWNNQFRNVFPNTDANMPVHLLRADGFRSLESVRSLRNRIAHHEPIFRNNLQEEYDRIRAVIAWSNTTAAAWVDKIERVTMLIGQKP